MTEDPVLFEIVKNYAHNEAAFHTAFGQAMLVVSELGCENLFAVPDL